MTSGSEYSDDFPEASGSASDIKPSPHRTQQPSNVGKISGGGTEEEEHYSDTFDEEETGEAQGRQSSGGRDRRGNARSQSRSSSSRSSGSRSRRSSARSKRSVSRKSSPSRSSHRSASSAGDPRGKVMDISQLFAAAAPDPGPVRSQAAAAGSGSEHSRDSRSARSSGEEKAQADDPRGRVLDISQLPSCSGPAAGQAQPPADARETRHHASAVAGPNLLSGPSQWRTPDILEPPSGYPALPSESAALPPAARLQREHDALPRHLKPHSWDIASLGQEPPSAVPKEAWAADGTLPVAQPLLGRGLAPVGSGPGGFGGARGPLVPSTEAQLVNRLAERFVLDRKAPLLERKERQAYKEMLQQVSWTALEPSLAQEAALLLSKRWFAPVSSTETLRAFRRCLHSILSDDRVLDIVEHQMALHFGRTAGAAA